MKGKKLYQIFSWYLAYGLNRMEWQHTIAMGFLALWIILIGAVDWPLRTETRHMTSQLASHLGRGPAKPRSTGQQSAPREQAREFVASLPEYEKYPEQLRALSLLADKSGAVIMRTDYRYEQLSGLPIRKLTLRIDIRGDEAQQRRFLLTMLNAFANLSVARLAYAKSTDRGANIEQKLDVNLHYQSDLKGGA